MKKIILTLFVGVLVFTSCNKDVSCECTITNTNTYSGGGNSISETTTSSSKIEVKKINKRALMKQNPDFCKSGTDSYSSTDVDGNGDVFTTTSTETYDCKLGK